MNETEHYCDWCDCKITEWVFQIRGEEHPADPSFCSPLHAVAWTRDDIDFEFVMKSLETESEQPTSTSIDD